MRFGRRKRDDDEPWLIDSRRLPGIPDVFSPGDATYGTQRMMARDMANRDWNTPTERGLALSLLAVIEDFENHLREEREAR